MLIAESQRIDESLRVFKSLDDDSDLAYCFVLDQIYKYHYKRASTRFIESVLIQIGYSKSKNKIHGVFNAITEYQLLYGVSKEVIDQVFEVLQRKFYNNSIADSNWIKCAFNLILYSYDTNQFGQLNELMDDYRPFPEVHGEVYFSTILKCIQIERVINPSFKTLALDYINRVNRKISTQQINKEVRYYLENKILPEMKNISTKRIKVFVSYSHDSESHKKKIISFTHFLRNNDFDAECDTLLKQRQSSIDFTQMMHDSIFGSDKIVIVLTEGYKDKADNKPKSGVREEVRMIKSVLEENDKKIILVCFESITDNPDLIAKISPNWLKGRQIVDLKKDQDSEFRELFSKLMEIEIIEFDQVKGTKPKIKTEKIEKFRL